MLVPLGRAQALLLLLLLSNPVFGWVAWYGSTQRDTAPLSAAVTTAATQRYASADETPEAVSVASRRPPTSPSPTTPPPPPPPSGGGTIDLLRLLNLSAGTPGVAQVPGPILNVPAFKLRPGFRLVQVPEPGAVAAALASPAGFTLVFVYRQHRKSLGTLLSVHPPGRVTPWFQLASNLRTGHLLLHYRLTTDEKLHQNAWSLRPAASAAHSPRGNAIPDADHGRKGGFGWTYVSLSLNTTTRRLRLQLDCQPPREQPLAGGGGGGGGSSGGGGSDDRGGEAGGRPRLDIPEDALVYFRQEPGFKKKFLGSMQVAKLYPNATTEHSDWTCKGNQIVRQWQ